MSLLVLVFIAVALVGATAFSAVPSNKSPPSAQNFVKWKRILQDSPTFNVTQAGGWHTVESLATHPKQSLVEYVMDYNNGDIAGNPTKLFALVGLLQAQGKGFESDLVDGAWISVLSQQGTQSPKLQKLVSKGDRKQSAPSYANFTVQTQTFHGDVPIFKYGSLQSTVSYNPVKDAHDVINDKIVLRRISCDIVGASWKWWKLPRIPLPLRAKGGYLDFVHLDADIRVTRGNRGGVFIHFRPEFLQRQQDERRENHEHEFGEASK